MDHKVCMVYQSSPPSSQLELAFRVFRVYSEWEQSERESLLDGKANYLIELARE